MGLHDPENDREDREIDLAHSDRSKTPIEPRRADQWFVKMDELAEKALEAVRDKRVTFYPKRYEKTYSIGSAKNATGALVDSFGGATEYLSGRKRQRPEPTD